MLDVFSAKDLANIRASGLIGLSPYDNKKDKRFMDELKRNGVIE